MRGEIKAITRGEFLRHTYGHIDKFSKRGEAMIGFNSVTRKYQMAWVDEVHMHDSIMFAEGDGNAMGFSVRGEYDTGPGQARGRWRTEYKLIDDDHLTITGYRVSIGDSEQKQLEIKYQRISKRETK